MKIRMLETIMNATWLSVDSDGVHRLRCNGCGEIHRVKFMATKAGMMALLLDNERNGIPAEEQTGEDILVPEAFYRAFEGED